MGITISSEIDAANKKAVERILAAEAVLTDIKPAIKAIPGFRKNLFTHAGPPVEWKDMCRPKKRAIIGLIMYEGLADTSEKAERLAETGEVIIEPNHHYDNVSRMCGVTSASMQVFVI